MNELPIVKYMEQRVLTTKQLAEVYGVETTLLINNFNRNSKHFIKGVHYYLLKGQDLRAFKDYISQRDVVDKRALIYIYGLNEEQIGIVRYLILIKHGSSLIISKKFILESKTL